MEVRRPKEALGSTYIRSGTKLFRKLGSLGFQSNAFIIALKDAIQSGDIFTLDFTGDVVHIDVVRNGSFTITQTLKKSTYGEDIVNMM